MSTEAGQTELDTGEAGKRGVVEQGYRLQAHCGIAGARMLKVFVLLPRRHDVQRWSEKFAAGDAVDRTPYGYHHASGDNVQISFSSPTGGSGMLGLIGRALNRLLGFDIAHALTNRAALCDPRIQAVWTHTEIEGIAALALFRFVRRGNPPVVIVQSIWLPDMWSSIGLAKRSLYRYLLRGRSVCMTFHTDRGANWARQHHLASLVECVRFGVSESSFGLRAPRRRASLDATAVRVLSVGNDRHRDWDTLFAALGGAERYQVTLATGRRFGKTLPSNFRAESLSLAGLKSAYESADVVVVCLKTNTHASGLTVALEAMRSGLPVVISNSGGLDEYFTDEMVRFVPISNPYAVRSAVEDAIINFGSSAAMVMRAQENILRMGLTSRGFANRHVEISDRMTRGSLEGNLIE